MNNKNSLLLFVIAVVLILGCHPAWSQEHQLTFKEYKKSVALPKPIINGAVWENVTRDTVYNNCIIALHLQGYELEPLLTSKESGLIVTRAVNFYPPIWREHWIGGEYYLNVLVYETEANKVSINIQIKGTKLYDYKVETGGPIEGRFIRIEIQNRADKKIRYYEVNRKNGLINKVSEDMEQLLTKLETIQGKAISTTTSTIIWE